mgnify:CR=1 FL=1
MPGSILHLGATVTCMHAGPATPLSPFPRVLVSGQPITDDRHKGDETSTMLVQSDD